MTADDRERDEQRYEYRSACGSVFDWLGLRASQERRLHRINQRSRCSGDFLPPSPSAEKIGHRTPLSAREGQHRRVTILGAPGRSVLLPKGRVTDRRNHATLALPTRLRWCGPDTLVT